MYVSVLLYWVCVEMIARSLERWDLLNVPTDNSRNVCDAYCILTAYLVLRFYTSSG
jgi:hypothetical protein